MNVLLSNYNFHEDWIRDELRGYITENSRIVILPFSFSEKWICDLEQWNKAYSSENGKYYSEIVSPFLTFGVREGNIVWLNYFTHSKQKMIEYINASDVLFLTGGLPEKTVERVLQLGLSDTLREYKNVIIGASAGAMVQLPEYFISPDEDYEKFDYYKGLGLIDADFQIEVHYTASDVQNECISRAIRDKSLKVYAVGEDGGLILKDNTIKACGDVILFDIN